MRKHQHRDPEPAADAVDGLPGWVECGGELVFAVDFTSDGLPIGLRASEVDERDDWRRPPDDTRPSGPHPPDDIPF